MTIIPAWIRKKDESGVWAVLGSEPTKDAKEEFIPAEKIENVVLSEKESNGRTFGVIVLK